MMATQAFSGVRAGGTESIELKFVVHEATRAVKHGASPIHPLALK